MTSKIGSRSPVIHEGIIEGVNAQKCHCTEVAIYRIILYRNGPDTAVHFGT